MKAICPNNSEHKEFNTTAHVMQDWKVDENGEWIETTEPCVQISSKPDPQNTWECAICGTEAVVTN